MKQRVFILLIMFWLIPLAQAQETQHLEVDIKGMSCKFCVRSVEKNLSKLDGVTKVSVNLDIGIAQIIMEPGKKGDATLIKERIKKAGFTPGDIRVVNNSKSLPIKE